MLSKVIKEFINDMFTVINGEDYFIDNGNYRKLITNENEKYKLIMVAHNIGKKDTIKHIKDLRKISTGTI